LTLVQHIVQNLKLIFNYKKYNKIVKKYTYQKPENIEQIKFFNKDRIEFRSDW
jgi:hypothetical protein